MKLYFYLLHEDMLIGTLDTIKVDTYKFKNMVFLVTKYVHNNIQSTEGLLQVT